MVSETEERKPDEVILEHSHPFDGCEGRVFGFGGVHMYLLGDVGVKRLSVLEILNLT